VLVPARLPSQNPSLFLPELHKLGDSLPALAYIMHLTVESWLTHTGPSFCLFLSEAEDKSLKKAATIRVAVDFNDNTNMFEVRGHHGDGSNSSSRWLAPGKREFLWLIR
jgi:hypothetical protein